MHHCTRIPGRGAAQDRGGVSRWIDRAAHDLARALGYWDLAGASQNDHKLPSNLGEPPASVLTLIVLHATNLLVAPCG